MTKVLIGNLQAMTSGPGEKVLIDQIKDGDDGAPGEDSTIPGPTGPVGPKGDPGVQGIQGVKGDQGIQGVKGDQGIQGVKGDQGIQGVKGDQGIPGTNGIDSVIDQGLFLDREQTMSRLDVTGAITRVSGTLVLNYFTARANRTITNLRFINSTGPVTPSLIRLGLFSVDPNGDLTLIGSTPNDLTMMTSTNSVVTKAMSAPANIVKGNRYAFGVLVVSAGSPGLQSGLNLLNVGLTWLDPKMIATVPAQTDLPANIASASLVSATTMFYWEALP